MARKYDSGELFLRFAQIVSIMAAHNRRERFGLRGCRVAVPCSLSRLLVCVRIVAVSVSCCQPGPVWTTGKQHARQRELNMACEKSGWKVDLEDFVRSRVYCASHVFSFFLSFFFTERPETEDGFFFCFATIIIIIIIIIVVVVVVIMQSAPATSASPLLLLGLYHSLAELVEVNV